MFRRVIPVLFVFFLASYVHVGFTAQPAQPVIAPTGQVIDTPSKGVAPQANAAIQTEQSQLHSNPAGTGKPEVANTIAAAPGTLQMAADKAAVPVAITQPSSQPESNAAQVPPVVIELLPHKATYSVTLDKNSFENKNYADEDIENANGQMTIQVAKAGDGWAIEQKLTLHIYYKDGSAEQVITSLATYESMDGLKYNFNARTLRGDEEEVISGDAILASKGGAGIVTYQQPDESTVQLPVGTIFPTQHLIYMLEAAMKGQKVVSNIVFDGSSETHEPVQVNTILGGGQEPKLALNNKDLLQFKKVWPMRMAIYAVDSPSAEPDYEINQNVLDRGVIRDMTLDYGSFKVKAMLQEVVVFS
jgi:hypothetical protein